jgi:hypothetical protein
MTTTTPHPTVATTVAAPSGRTRIVAAGIAISAATIALLVLTHPWGDRLDSSADDVVSYAGLPANIDAAWTAMLFDSLAYGLLSICLAIGCWRLVTTRGRLAATVGGVITAVGGVVNAMGGLAFATLLWFAATLPEEQGRGLVDTVNDEIGHALGVEMAGFALVTLGSLVLAAALVRARAVPWPAVAVFVALTVSLFLGFPGDVMNVLQAAQVLVAGALAVPLWQRG